MASLKTTLLILTFITFHFFATHAAALPTVIETGQYTDRFLATLQNTVIPPGDNLQIFAVIDTTDAPGSSTIAVTAKQGDTIRTLDHFANPSTPPNFYWTFIDFDPALTGAWEIVPTDSTGTGPSAFTDALVEPELIPYVESITPQGSPRGAAAEWILPDLTGFDVDDVHVRIVQVEPRGEVFSSDVLPAQTSSFEPPPGILQYGVEYVYLISLIDAEGFYLENRSGAQSQPFRFALPGDFNLDGTVDAVDYVTWRDGLGSTYSMAEYDEWKSHFGQSLDSGFGSSYLQSEIPNLKSFPAIPEPATLVLAIMTMAASLLVKRSPAPARWPKSALEFGRQS